MTMTGRERLLTALNNGKPDRLPCLIHAWVDYHLKNTMKGMDQFQAYDCIGMDPVIYVTPKYIYDDDKDSAHWRVDHRDLGVDADGNRPWTLLITTPDGVLTSKGASNEYTGWTTEYIIKSEQDFELWNKYVPLPERVDWEPVRDAKRKVGDRGIVRGYAFDFGQLSPWQTFLCLFGTQPAIMACFDNPDWMHHVLDNLLKKKLTVLSRSNTLEYDLVESGGGGGSSTVISPTLHREFCLPYDRIQHKAIKEYGVKIVYHLCGGVMPLLDLVAENGSDGLETMTPPSMGGDCDLAEARRRVGDKLFFIGGFDQNAGFERGNPQLIREMVFNLHRCCPNGGYICAPSDQFFQGSIENLRAFADACRECRY